MNVYFSLYSCSVLLQFDSVLVLFKKVKHANLKRRITTQNELFLHCKTIYIALNGLRKHTQQF